MGFAQIMEPVNKETVDMNGNTKRLSDIAYESHKHLNGSSTKAEVSRKPFKREIVWRNAIVYLASHVVAFYGFYLWVFDSSLVQFLSMFALANWCLTQGVTMGAHRYYTNRCFKASQTMKVIILLAQTAASQNCMWIWVRDHRQHHKYSDTDADPHNASNGFFFSHVGWLLCKKHPEVIEKGRGIDMSDLNADPLVMLQKKHYFALWIIFALVLPVLIPVYVFGEPWIQTIIIWDILRIVLTLNITWLVNSWAHLYGTKPFDKNIMPCESKYVSIVTQGEGWHNYHHTFPGDYKASELDAPFNMTTAYIRLCARLGLVWDLKEASEEVFIARSARTGDGTPMFTRTKEA